MLKSFAPFVWQILALDQLAISSFAIHGSGHQQVRYLFLFSACSQVNPSVGIGGFFFQQQIISGNSMIHLPVANRPVVKAAGHPVHCHLFFSIPIYPVNQQLIDREDQYPGIPFYNKSLVIVMQQVCPPTRRNECICFCFFILFYFLLF
jgi:hypothetical protein